MPRNANRKSVKDISNSNNSPAIESNNYECSRANDAPAYGQGKDLINHTHIHTYTHTYIASLSYPK